MQLVLTLIAGPNSAQHLSSVAAIVAAAATAPIDWLAPAIACDLAFDATDAVWAEATARQAIGDAAIDVIVQPTANRRKHLLVVDMESTIIENEMLDELADFV